MRNLASLSKTELRAFLDSFDGVLCDCDGVLWIATNSIPGADKTISKLKQCGKRIYLVSNNSGYTLDIYEGLFKKFGFDVSSNDIAVPVQAIIDYLETCKFDKKILFMGSSTMEKQFIKAGFTIASIPDKIGDSLDTLEDVTKDNKNVGAVIVDADFDVNYPKIMKACACLERPDVLYIIGATEKKIPFRSSKFLMGPKYIQNVITDFIGRPGLILGKPGLHFGKYVIKKFGIKNASRTLLVGDSLEQDMGFADQCGFQKLLVLTGNTTLREMKKCSTSEWTPDYYIESFADLHKLIDDKLDV